MCVPRSGAHEVPIHAATDQFMQIGEPDKAVSAQRMQKKTLIATVEHGSIQITVINHMSAKINELISGIEHVGRGISDCNGTRPRQHCLLVKSHKTEVVGQLPMQF